MIVLKSTTGQERQCGRAALHVMYGEYITLSPHYKSRLPPEDM